MDRNTFFEIEVRDCFKSLFVNEQTQILNYVSTLPLVLIFKKANYSNLKDLFFMDDKWASETS